MALSIDHVAIAVKDIEAVAKKYSKALGVDVIFEIIDSECVRVAILDLDNARIELISPIGDKGPIAKFLAKNGEGLHHIALRTENIESEVSRMQTCGLEFLGKIRNGSSGTRIIFVHPKSLNSVLIELCSAGV